jgi:hypothetical protein
MTKKEWETQAIKIEAAQLATDLYSNALQNSLKAIEAMNVGWQKILDKLAEYKTTNFPSLPDGTNPGTDPEAELPPGKDPKPKGKKSPAVVSVAKPYAGSGFYGSALSGAGTNYSSGVMGSKGPTLKPMSYTTIANPLTKTTTTVRKKYMGGMISKFASGGFAVGTDTVPAMLTPGEFIVSKYGVDKFGVDNLKAINKGDNPSSSSVYNYNLSVNVKSDANPNEIARTVMMQIKQIDSQRIKGNRI